MGTSPKPRGRLLATLAVACLLASACGSATAPTASGAAPATKTTSAASTSAKPAGPQYGGTLTWGRRQLANGLDPHHILKCGCPEQWIAFETLVRYNQQLKLVPDLAASWDIPNPTTYVFHLRHGVKFQDGTPFNAAAVKFNFTRMLSSYSSIRSHFSYIKSVAVVDPYTVKITLSKPFAPFLDNVAAVGAMVSPTAVKKYGNQGFQKHPVGTGPYEFVSWDTTKGEITYKRFPGYWGGKPYLNEVVFRQIPDSQTRYLALTTGKIDYMDGVPPTDITSLQHTKGFAVESILGKSNTIDYLTYNTKKPPFNNANVRIAFAYALNQKQILSFLPHAQAIYGPLPPSSWGADPNQKPYPYDPAKAKKMLAAAGFPNGMNVTLEIWSNDQQRQNLATVVKTELAQVGVKVSVKVLDSTTLINQMSKGDFSFASLHWGGLGSLDPWGNLYTLFDSHGEFNYISGYHTAKIDSLLNQALVITDHAQRQKLYREAYDLLYKAQPMYWFGRFDTFNAYNTKLHGANPVQATGYWPRFSKLWLQQ